MEKLQKILSPFKSLLSWMFNIFDLRDFFVLGGISLLWHGLYMREPWVSFVVCGSVLIVFGIISSVLANK